MGRGLEPGYLRAAAFELFCVRFLLRLEWSCTKTFLISDQEAIRCFSGRRLVGCSWDWWPFGG